MTDKAAKVQQKSPDQTPTVEEEADSADALSFLPLTLAPGDLPNHSTSQPLRRIAVARHQAHQGNQAVQRLLQRDDKDKPVKSGLDASMIKVTVFKQPTISEALKVTKISDGPDGTVAINAPLIEGEYGVTLDSTMTIGDKQEIKVGPVQTMTSSERVGIYKRDGKVVAEYRYALGQSRDARPLAEKPGGPFEFAEPPFYDIPVKLSDANPSGNFSFKDKPGFQLPLEFGGGRLAGLRGADRFNTSVGAKRDGTTITMNPFGWQMSWTTDLGDDFSVPTDSKGNPINKQITTWEEKQGLAIDSKEVAYQILKTQDPIFSFKTLDAALATPSSLLLLGLPGARRADPASAALIEQALAQKDPVLQIKFEAARVATHNTFSTDEDTLETFASITKQSAVKGPFTFQVSGTQTTSVKLSEVADISALNPSSKFEVWLGGAKDVAILGETASFAYPFAGSQTLELNGSRTGVYHIYVNIL